MDIITYLHVWRWPWKCAFAQVIDVYLVSRRGQTSDLDIVACEVFMLLEQIVLPRPPRENDMSFHKACCEKDHLRSVTSCL